MIGSFWNLCRACPSMPVDKLHSEYRSTYRWHEYKGAAGAAAAGGAGGAGGVVRQPAPAPASSLPHTRGTNMFTGPVEPAMPRRKKYPGVAYKSNDLFDPSSAPEHERLKSVTTSTLDRARSVERNDSRPGAGRRSKSEGPRQPRWTDTVEAKGTATGTGLGEVLATKEPPETSTEYRNQFAWPKDANDSSAPRKSTSMGTLKLGAGRRKPVAGDGATEMEPLMNHTEDSNVNEEHASKKYIEDYLWNGHKPGVPRKSTFRNALSAFISNGEDRSKDNRKRYKSEYKKKFRPFSQYVFEASKGTFTKCRGIKGKAGSLEREEGSTERMLPAQQQQTRAPDAPPAPDSAARGLAPKDGESWYREVLDLRKRAGEYKYRGWGTELAPEHITQLYDKQIELWYQVSRRSSLSALSLAATNHKALPSGEKEAADARSRSPKKVRSFRSAPHQSIHAKLSETRQSDRSPQKTSPQKVQRKKIQGHSFDETAAANEGKASVNKRGVEKDGKRSSPRKELNIVVGGPNKEFRSPRRRPRSADPKPAAQPVLNGHEPPKLHKPTGLPLNSRVKSTTKKTPAKTPSPTSATANNASRRSRSVSKVGIKLEDDAPASLRSASVAKDHVFDDTPVVKSPPEPTRVKSPEQMNMRSPDPVNWTVPLDTGKTFTVTQNVKNDDNIKRPSSEFKATSICEDVTAEATEGLGEGAVAQGEELVPVHHQLSPIRTLKKSDSPTGVHKRSEAYNKTPTSPASLTPIDETKTLDITRPITNGSHSTQPSPADNPKLSLTESITSKTPDNPIASKYAEITAEMTKKPTEATQKATGVVDTSVVNENTSAYTAAEVLDRARNRFDKFWGKQEEDNV